MPFVILKFWPEHNINTFREINLQPFLNNAFIWGASISLTDSLVFNKSLLLNSLFLRIGEMQQIRMMDINLHHLQFVLSFGTCTLFTYKHAVTSTFSEDLRYWFCWRHPVGLCYMYLFLSQCHQDAFCMTIIHFNRWIHEELCWSLEQDTLIYALYFSPRKTGNQACMTGKLFTESGI